MTTQPRFNGRADDPGDPNESEISEIPPVPPATAVVRPPSRVARTRPAGSSSPAGGGGVLRTFFSRQSAAVATDPRVSVLRGAAAEAQRSRLPQMAAALSYRTIFSLVPILAIGLWIMHRIVAGNPQHLEDFIRSAINFLGLSSLSVEDSGVMGPPAPPGLSKTPASELPSLEAAPVATEVAAVHAQSVDAWITDTVARINSVSFAAISYVGFVMLIYAAISMVIEVERAFNQIFRVPRGRSISRRLVNYWTLLTLGPLCLFLTFFIGLRLEEWAESLTQGRLVIGSGVITVQLVGYLLQVVVSTALLLVIYLVVPNAKVKWWPAVCGALLAAVAFEVSKWGFGLYVAQSAGVSYTRLYGSLALIPLFLLWVYFTWMIVLFGLQVVYHLQHGRARTTAQPIVEIGPALVDPAAALVVLGKIARRFERGTPSDATELAAACSINEPVVRLVLTALAEHGYVHRVDNEHAESPGGFPEPRYALSRAPSAISVADVLQLGFRMASAGAAPGDAPPERVDPARSAILDRLHRAQVDAAGSETLASLLAAETSPPRPPKRLYTPVIQPSPAT